MSKQTAVQWLFQQIYGDTGHIGSYTTDGKDAFEAFEQAKAMEREQMGLPNCKPMDEQIISVTILDPKTGKTYTRKTHGLEETYKGGEQ